MRAALACLLAVFFLINVGEAFDHPPTFATSPSGFTLDEISDVDTGGIANDILINNGVTWTPWTPAYGTLEFTAALSATASTVTVYNGTIDAGDVTNTTTINGVYLEVSESGQFLIDFAFTLGTNTPAVVDIVGRYEGNPAHVVKAKAWNYNTSDWDDMTSEANDFLSSATDANFRFPFPDQTNYLSAGQAIVRLDHESGAVGSHDMFIDFIKVEVASISMASAGTFYLINSGSAGASLNTTLDTAAGSITVGPAGDYLPSLSTSFTGKATGETGTNYHFHVFVNDVEQYKTGIARTISNSTDIGSGHGNGILSLSANDVLTVKARSEIDNAYVSLSHFIFTVHRLLGK